jgi:cellulose synthase operon protein C
VKNAYEPSAEEIQAFVDGELSPMAAERVRSALDSSPGSLAELDDCLQLAALAHELRHGLTEHGATSARTIATTPVIPFVPRARRLRPRLLLAAMSSLSLVGAAAAILLAVRGDGRPSGGGDVVAAFAGALGPSRAIEPRLSWAGADRYRPYDTARAGGPARPAESIPLELLGRVEQLGDPRAKTAAQVLTANVPLAVQAIASVRNSPDVDSDRAAVALLEGNPEDALLAAADALEADPAHVQATWNRGLALERLGMPLTAADAFAAVASRGEPGWSQEATGRAADLRAQLARRQAAWKAANATGEALVAGGQIDGPTVAAFPGLVRRYLYDAVAVAGSAERVRALRPLAETLDAHYGGQHLVAYVDRIAPTDFRRRGPLAARHAALVRGELTDPVKVRALLGALRAARQNDMLLGALVRSGAVPWQVDERDLGEYVALARATGDPWFQLVAEEQRAMVALAREDDSVAQTVLEAAAVRCGAGSGAGSIDYRCERVFRLLIHVYVSLHRPEAARLVFERMRRVVRATGSMPMETELLRLGHEVASTRDDTTGSLLALSKAYLDEWSRHGSSCALARATRESMAMALMVRYRFDEARRELADKGACDAPFTSQRAFVLAFLLRRRGDDSEVQDLRDEISSLRAAVPAERAWLDHIEGRLLVDRAPAEGRALLQRAIAGAREATTGNVLAAKARSYSYSILVEDAVERGLPGEALDLLAEERGLPRPARCVLGAVKEDAAVFAARGADGSAIGDRIPLAPGNPTAPTAMPEVPDAMRAALAGCEAVDVFARQPYYGRPELLPRDMAWQFRTGAPTREPPAPAGPTVVVANIDPPAGLDLARLNPVGAAKDTVMLEGATATPERVMSAAAAASFLEIHAHGLQAADESGASIVVLAPDPGGRYALAADDIRRARLRGAPVVVLAACHASAIGSSFHSTWGLVDAFAAAGARAVIASPDPIQDAGAPAFFAALRGRIIGGQVPAAALRDARLAVTDAAERAWVDRLVVFH